MRLAGKSARYTAEPPTGMWERMEAEKLTPGLPGQKARGTSGSRWRGWSHPIRAKQSQLRAELLWSTDTSHQPPFDFQCRCNMTFPGRSFTNQHRNVNLYTQRPPKRDFVTCFHSIFKINATGFNMLSNAMTFTTWLQCPNMFLANLICSVAVNITCRCFSAASEGFSNILGGSQHI